MTDQSPTYESLGLVPGLNSPPPPPPTLAPPARSKVKIRIFKASQPAPPAPHPTPIPSIRRPLPTFHCFLELPGEIRNIIYQFVFAANATVMGARQLRLLDRDRGGHQEKYDEKWAADRKHKRNYLAVGILRTSHLVYHEALPFLYMTDNTIIITTSKMLQNFTGMPDPLPRCTEHCIKDKSITTGSGPGSSDSNPIVPVIYNGVLYPKEYDLAYSRYDPNMEFLNDYLPVIAGTPLRHPTIGIVFKHLTLDISTQTPSMRNLYEALCFSSIKIKETFTIRCWDFQRPVRIWIKSSDCTNTLIALGLQKKPIVVEELPATGDGETYTGQRRAWKVTWKKGLPPKPTTTVAGPSTTTDADAPADEDEPLPDWTETTGATPNDPIEVPSDDEDTAMTNSDAPASEDEDEEEQDDGEASDSSSSSDEEDLTGNIVPGGAYKARGQVKIQYSELKHMQIPDADLALQEIFAGFPVTREIIAPVNFPNGRVLGE